MSHMKTSFCHEINALENDALMTRKNKSKVKYNLSISMTLSSVKKKLAETSSLTQWFKSNYSFSAYLFGLLKKKESSRDSGLVQSDRQIDSFSCWRIDFLISNSEMRLSWFAVAKLPENFPFLLMIRYHFSNYYWPRSSTGNYTNKSIGLLHTNR